MNAVLLSLTVAGVGCKTGEVYSVYPLLGVLGAPVNEEFRVSVAAVVQEEELRAPLHRRRPTEAQRRPRHDHFAAIC